MNAPRSIVLSQADYAICKQFANDVFDTNKRKYSQRMQSDELKVKQDIIIGKMSELGAERILEADVKVDFSILQVKDKSYKPDLIKYPYNIHVKTQEVKTGKMFGKSWLFTWSKNGKEGCDPLILNPSQVDLLALCTFDLSNYKMLLEYLLKATDVLVYLREPVLERLVPFKRVLYENDIKNVEQFTFEKGPDDATK